MNTVVSESLPADIPAEEYTAPSDEHLAERGLFLKEFDLLDIDHGHFWHKALWHGIHVEFPNRAHYYEPDPMEHRIRDYFIYLPVYVLTDAYKAITADGVTSHKVCHGDHCFELVWDTDVQQHLHCFYERSEQGREKDRRRYEQHVQAHAQRYETDRQFPSWRLHEELRHLREQRARAQKVVDSWNTLIAQCEARIAEDELIHLGRVSYSS